ncbi:MAG: hypothetical protein DPW09_21050 [Anaerolineae bacterium]|nr:hypothetical protein [Anaerolineae bacterium]
MNDEILRRGDQAIYEPMFTPAQVRVRPGILTGTGRPVKIIQQTVCVQGDEASATVPGCAYVSGGFTIPGQGTLSISALGADQVSSKCRSGGRGLLRRGTRFTASFQVTVPAQMPTAGGPVPDPVPLYTGSGTFQTGNVKVRDRG